MDSRCLVALSSSDGDLLPTMRPQSSLQVTAPAMPAADQTAIQIGRWMAKAFLGGAWAWEVYQLLDQWILPFSPGWARVEFRQGWVLESGPTFERFIEHPA